MQNQFWVGALIGAAIVLAIWWYHLSNKDYQEAELGEPQPVDPWAMQRELMRMSDQYVPRMPTLTKEGVMYAALILEEASEMAKHVSEAITTHAARHQSVGESLASEFYAIQYHMHLTSTRVRKMLDGMMPFYVPLERRHARALMDDTTDITVVNSGFALAVGLDGPGAYKQVATSNHSKANPHTGFIDKEPNGKWIKGSAYKEPDLEALLDVAYGTAQVNVSAHA